MDRATESLLLCLEAAWIQGEMRKRPTIQDNLRRVLTVLVPLEPAKTARQSQYSIHTDV